MSDRIPVLVDNAERDPEELDDVRAQTELFWRRYAAAGLPKPDTSVMEDWEREIVEGVW